MSNLKSNPHIVALVMALNDLALRGLEGCEQPLTTVEGDGLIKGILRIEDVAKPRSVDPKLLYDAWQYEYTMLTGMIAVPVSKGRLN